MIYPLFCIILYKSFPVDFILGAVDKDSQVRWAGDEQRLSAISNFIKTRHRYAHNM
jgi:hypothetical protein